MRIGDDQFKQQELTWRGCDLYSYSVDLSHAIVPKVYPVYPMYNTRKLCNGIVPFLPAQRYASAGLCDSDVSGRLSVCPSVRPSVIRRYCA